jgi:hypothetical protein
MAFSGVHLFCSEAGGDNGGTDNYNVQTYRNPLWSETIASAGTSQNEAPQGNRAILRIESSAEIYGAIGKTPDASKTVSTGSSSARFRIKADTPFDIYLKPGDKFAWIAMP